MYCVGESSVASTLRSILRPMNHNRIRTLYARVRGLPVGAVRPYLHSSREPAPCEQPTLLHSVSVRPTLPLVELNLAGMLQDRSQRSHETCLLIRRLPARCRPDLKPGHRVTRGHSDEQSVLGQDRGMSPSPLHLGRVTEPRSTSAARRDQQRRGQPTCIALMKTITITVFTCT